MLFRSDAYGKGDARGELCRRERKISTQTKCEGEGRREDMRQKQQHMQRNRDRKQRVCWELQVLLTCGE